MAVKTRVPREIHEVFADTPLTIYILRLLHKVVSSNMRHRRESNLETAAVIAIA